MNLPLVSVIMPAYNGAKFIKESINSVLNQTYKNFELIIIEDGSIDSTLAVINEFADERIRLYCNGCNKGISYSTNLATKLSLGKYIALLDDDDLAAEHRLEWQVEYLEEHPEIDVLGGRSIDIDEKGRFLKYEKEPIYNSKLIKANLLFYNRKFANCTVMYRRDFVLRNKIEYEENCLGMQDVKFYMECSKVGNISSIDRVLHYKRVHPNEETAKQREKNADKRREIFANFQRYSITKSGFDLSDDDFCVIASCISDTMRKSYSMDDVKKLFEVFKKIITQGRNMKIDYLPELELSCKKILGEKILPNCVMFES